LVCLPVSLQTFNFNIFADQNNYQMKKTTILLIVLAAVVLIGFMWYRNIFNTELKLNQQVKSQWANVESSYQRRADLIPNLVNTVKGYAEHEKSTFIEVIEARAKATSINVNPENLNEKSLQQFQEAQNGLSSALSRLLVVVERYPDLKANQNFLELQAQLEGTENRINVERSRFNDTVKSYNSFVGRFLIKPIFHFQEKPYFEAQEGTDVAPIVQF
jgi:LemA protein